MTLSDSSKSYDIPFKSTLLDLDQGTTFMYKRLDQPGILRFDIAVI